jgi:lysophospholipase L1-like esterase
MKKSLRLIIGLAKWLLLAVVAVEVLSFLIVTLSNGLIYGSIWEGSRVLYDPYVLYREGVRPTAFNAPDIPRPGHRTIWLFGGSTMRGGSLAEEKTIPSFLAQILNGEGKPLSFTLVNFGENSFNSLLETKYLQKALIESSRPPDLIIFYDGANDSGYTAQYRTPDAHHSYRKMRALVESYRRSFFGLLKPLNAAWYASFTRELYDKAHQVALPLQSEEQWLQECAAATARRYEHVRRLAAGYGASFLLFRQPILWVETGAVAPAVQEKEKEKDYQIMGARFSSVRWNFAVAYDVLFQGVRDKPYFIDFRDVLVSRTTLVYKPDGVHLLAAGNEMVARNMSRVLREKYLADEGREK